MASYGNFTPYEGSLSGEVTITFDRPIYKLILTNDSAVQELEFRFKGSVNATLKPTETLSTDMKARFITLNGTGSYRLWVWG